MPSIKSSADGAASSGVGTVTVTLPVDVADNDLTLLFVMSNSGGNRLFTEISGTWTKLVDDFILGSPNDCNCALFRKVQGATPDTSVSVSVDVTNNILGAILLVVEDADVDDPEDVPVVVVKATGATDPDPGAITTITAGALVIAFAASSEADAITNPPAGYSNLVDRQVSSTVNVMAAAKEVAVAGVEDPPAFTDLVPDAGDAWITVTYAVRPRPAVIPIPASKRAVSLLGVSGGGPIITPPPQPSFILFDEFRYGDISNLGFVDIFFLYQSQMVAPGDQATDPPDPVFLDDRFAELASNNPGVDRIVLDYETWELFVGGVGSAVNPTTVGWYVTLVEAAKPYFSNVGLYGEIPERYTLHLIPEPGSATHLARRAAWFDRSLDLQPMFDVVDTIYPSIYYLNPVHDDPVARDLWYEDIFEMCNLRAPGKQAFPVLAPYIHPSVDPAAPDQNGPYFRASLEKIRSTGYPGFVGWDGAGAPDPRTLNPIPAWWLEMEAFAATVT